MEKQNEVIQERSSGELHLPDAPVNGATIQMEDPNTGRVVLENGTTLLFTRAQSSPLYIGLVDNLQRTLATETPLPTQLIFPNQRPEDLEFVAKYINSIRKMINEVNTHGRSSSIESYSFRLPHFAHLEKWVNIVVRLQFARVLKTICDTLNAELPKSNKNKWGVLDFDPEQNIFLLNGKELPFGTRVDVFTTDEKVMSDMLFSSHSVLNCAEIDGRTLPVFHYAKEDLENLDYDSMAHRKEAAVGPDEYLLDSDAFSFLHGLLYRVHDKVEVVDIMTNLLTFHDRDPELSVAEYDSMVNLMGEMNLPYGLDRHAAVAFQNYHCKRASRAHAFMETLQHVSDNAKKFRKVYEKNMSSDSEIIIGLFDIFRYLAGHRSRVMKITGILKTGKRVDLVTINRSMVLEKFKSFTRYNTQPLYFEEIEYVKKKKKDDVDPDYFRPTGNLISSNELIGFVHETAKAYYWDDQEVEDKEKPTDSHNIVALYLYLKRKFANEERNEP